MIITDKMRIKVVNANKKYYIKMGYDVSLGYINVVFKDIPHKSHIKIICSCDICYIESNITVGGYYKNINDNIGEKYICKKCSNKTKDTCIMRYGVDNPMKDKAIKKKQESTLLENHGVKTPFKNINIRNKFTKTMLIRYGVEHALQNKKYLNKANDTIIERYGNHDIKQKYNSENSVYEFIKSKLVDCDSYCERSNRSILNGKELDIYIPSLNLAIEFNGLYWHSELFKDKSYHLNKTIECQNKGIQLIHIFEDDWNYKQDIIKSILRNKLNKIDEKIYARKCIIKEVKSDKARLFLDENHIQGFSKSTYKLGLYHDNELVSLMTFGYRRTNSKKEFELIRFCNKLNINVIGASSKLFNYFIKHYSNKIDDEYILSYADTSMFDGKMYKMLGFNEIHLTKPNYFWTDKYKKYHRWKYNKQSLIKEGYDTSKTEVEIMHERGYYRIYGTGQKRYEFNIITNYID